MASDSPPAPAVATPKPTTPTSSPAPPSVPSTPTVSTLRHHLTLNHGVFFTVDGKKDVVARLLPGASFFARSDNLSNVATSESALKAFFANNPEQEIRAVLAPVQKESRVVFCNESSVVIPGKRMMEWESRSLKEAKRKGRAKEMILGYSVVEAWTGDLGEEVPGEGSQLEKEVRAEVKDRMEVVRCNLLRGKDEQKELPKARWFVTSYWGARRPNWNKSEVPDKEEAAEGKITELHRPCGGIAVLTDGTEVYFHRSRLLVDGKRIGQTFVLEDHIAVGDSVSVHTVSNQINPGTTLYDNCRTEKVALWIQKGEKKVPLVDAPKTATEKFLNQHMTRNSQKVRLVSFLKDPEQGDRVTACLGAIAPSSGSEPADSPVGDMVFVPAKSIYFLGMSLEHTDLSYLFRIGDEVLANAVPIVESERQEALERFDDLAGAELRHTVTHASTIRMASDNTTFGVVPWINASSQSVFTAMHRKCFNISQLDREIFGWNSPRLSRCPPGYAPATITKLIPASDARDADVSGGELKVTLGPHRGRVLWFKRAAVNVFGHSCEKADLASLLTRYDRILVQMEGIGEDDSECMKVVVERADVASSDPESMTNEQRTDFLTWLQFHQLSFDDLDLVLKGEDRTPPPYIPFQKEMHNGLFRELGPLNKEKEEEKEEKKDEPMTYGLVEITTGFHLLDTPNDEGKMLGRSLGQQVAVHRSQMWVYGRSMDKADLAYIVPLNQKVHIEIEPMTESIRTKLFPGVADTVQWYAAVAWLGPARPLNKKHNPCEFDIGIHDWLAKREMNVEGLDKLAKGELDPKPASARNELGFVLKAEIKPKRKAEGNQKEWETNKRKNLMEMAMDGGAGGPPIGMMGGGPQRPNLDHLPVLCHGPEVADMLEGAIMANGPHDSLLRDLIHSDDLAQKAYHVSEALRAAVEAYKAKKSGMFGGGGNNHNHSSNRQLKHQPKRPQQQQGPQFPPQMLKPVAYPTQSVQQMPMQPSPATQQQQQYDANYSQWPAVPSQQPKPQLQPQFNPQQHFGQQPGSYWKQ